MNPWFRRAPVALCLLALLSGARGLAAEEGARPWWPWLFVGAGGGLLVTGGVLWGFGAADYADVNDAKDRADTNGVVPMTQRAAQDHQERGDLFSTLGPVFVGVGAALAATGTVLLLSLPDGEGDVFEARRGPWIEPLVGPDCLGLAGRFPF